MVMKEGTQTITFRIPGELKLQIEIEAAKQGRSVNNLLKQIVIEYLKNPKNKPIQAFILVVLHQPSGAGKLTEYIKSDPDILECYAVTGEYDYIIKVCARDVEQLEQKLNLLKQQKGVAKSYTMLSLMEHKYRACILPDEGKEEEK